MFSLAGKVALITGSARGLGKAMAIAAAEAGAHVILNSLHQHSLDAAVAELRGAGHRVSAARFDVSSAEEMGSAVDDLIAEHGRIDVLVNNAGQALRKPFLEYSIAEVCAVVNTHLIGTFMLTQKVARHMVQRGSGCIVMVSSIAAERGRGGHAPYAASKGAVTSLTKALAVELGPRGIRCNAIAPGFFETELNAELIQDRGIYSALCERIPQRRWGKPEDLGGVVVFLASDAASYLNGHVITIDGGVAVGI